MSATDGVQISKVIKFYDETTDILVEMGGPNLHMGYWENEKDDTPTARAAERFNGKLVERLAPRPGQRFLDIGCGVGGPALSLAGAADVSVVGVNINDYQLRQAAERAAAAGLESRVSFIRADAASLPFPDGSFDGAWFVEAMMHMPDKAGVLREAARTVRPGGRLVLAERFREEGTEPSRDGLHSLPTFEGYRRAAEEAGLTVLDITDVTAHTAFSEAARAEQIEASLRHRDRLIPLMGGEEAFEGMLERLRDGYTPPYLFLTALRT
ncbi:class I SAM-dependent methyltransferase [Streptomyces sp. YIM 98790]|uniref:class I SAM-dependent methyltransferase n=1 Tax=Streptomyces sp. YIM 98790 TaxID=2689077 RepID=UPI00140ABA7F|nr:methyltransferase domain-containing protein [Streptomyces sp. YIM 98790]